MSKFYCSLNSLGGVAVSNNPIKGENVVYSEVISNTLNHGTAIRVFKNILDSKGLDYYNKGVK